MWYLINEYYLLILCCCCSWSWLSSKSFAWNLDVKDEDTLNYVTTNENYTVIHVSVFYVRAFLTVKHHGNPVDHGVTIIESTWPENLFSFQSRVFPNDLSHAKSACDCNGILQTQQTAVDRPNSFLWLIDNGSTYCAPKIIVFDLVHGNAEVHRYVFNNLHQNTLKSVQLIATDNLLNRSENSVNGSNSLPKSTALILLDNTNHLLLYTIYSNCSQKLTLLYPVKSNKNKKTTIYNVLIPVEMTMKSETELVLTDGYNGLWMANLDEIQTSRIDRKRHPKIDLYVVVRYLGSLLGTPHALAVEQSIDAKMRSKHLYYHLPRDGAILRWNFQQPLTAEGHEVLHFAQQPIVQILFGAKGSAWIVHEHNDHFGDHCKRIYTNDLFNRRGLFL